MPDDSRLDLNQTFDSQKTLVNNTIVLKVMETLDLETFPVSEAIVYEMIHSRHRHQREGYLLKQQSKEDQDEYNRKNHCTSRRNDVSHLLFNSFYYLYYLCLF